jgi:hypothetical protein
MFGASRTGYSVPRSLLGVATNGSPSRFSGPRLSPSSKDDGSSSHRLQLFYRDPFRHRLLPLPTANRERLRKLLPWGSAPLQRTSTSDSARCRGSTPDANPPRPFSDPRGIPSPAPTGLFRPAAAHGVSTLQSVSPPQNSTGLVTQRYPLDVSPPAPKNQQLRPQGFVSYESPLPIREYCIPRRPDALLGFTAPTAFDGSGWRRQRVTTHPLMALASGAFSLAP